MSTDSSVLPRRQLRILPVAGAAAACLALISAMIAGPAGTSLPSRALAIVAIGCLLAEIGIRARRLLLAPEAPLVGLFALALVLVVTTVAVLGPMAGSALALLIGLVAAALIGVGASRARRMGMVSTSPWNAFRGRSGHETSHRLMQVGGPTIVGLIALVLAIGMNPNITGLLLVAAAGAVVFALLRTTEGAGRTSGTAAAGRTPDAVAAHLHDSVLQTLALIQRSADDPARVSQLARGQERELRDWLAGRDTSSTPTTVSAAVRAVAAEVEREHPGATIDVVCVGDTPLERRGEMLVQATREALRNAVGHGGPAVRVFSECEHGEVRVFVRDTGSGFNLDDVGEDRRGIRDAIVGRMRHVDGRVTIDSTEHGTEIELHLPASGATDGH